MPHQFTVDVPQSPLTCTECGETFPSTTVAARVECKPLPHWSFKRKEIPNA